MARFSLQNFVSALEQVAAGQLQGQIAAQQENERRQREAEQRALEAQDRQRQFLTGVLPQLTPDSQQLALSQLASQAFGAKPSVSEQFGARLGEIDRRFPSKVAPPAPVAPPAAPGAGPTATSSVYAPPGQVQPVSPVIAGMLNQQQMFAPDTWRDFNASATTPIVSPAAPTAPVTSLSTSPYPTTTTPATPAVAPPVETQLSEPEAPSRRAIDVKGVGKLYLRGVDPKTVKDIRAEYGRLADKLMSVNLDPVSKKAASDLIASFPQRFDSEQDLVNAQNVVVSLRQSLAGMGPLPAMQAKSAFDADVNTYRKDLETVSGARTLDQFVALAGRALENEAALDETAKGMKRTFLPVLAASRPDIERLQLLAADPEKRAEADELFRRVRGRLKGELTPQGEAAIVSQFLQLARAGNFRRLSPEATRKWFEDQGAGYLVAALPDGSLPGTAEAEKQFSATLRSMPQWSKLSPRDQRPYIEELRALAKLTGRDPGAIPNSVKPAISDIEKQRMALGWYNAKTGRMRAEDADLNRELSRQRLEFDKQQAREKQRQRDGTLTKAESARIAEISRQRAALQQELQGLNTEFFVNVRDGGTDVASRRASRLKDQINAYTADIDAILNRGAAREKRGVGKTETGSLIRELADPNRPENRAAAAGEAERKRRTLQRLNALIQKKLNE